MRTAHRTRLTHQSIEYTHNINHSRIRCCLFAIIHNWNEAQQIRLIFCFVHFIIFASFVVVGNFVYVFSGSVDLFFSRCTIIFSGFLQLARLYFQSESATNKVTKNNPEKEYSFVIHKKYVFSIMKYRYSEIQVLSLI